MARTDRSPDRINKLYRRLDETSSPGARRAVLLELAEALAAEARSHSEPILHELLDESVRREDPDTYVRAAYLMADVMLRRGYLDRAARHIEQFREAAGEEPWVRLAIPRLSGVLHEARGEYEQARRSYERYLELSRREDGVEERHALIALGRLAALRADFAGAAGLLSQASTAGPDEPDRVTVAAHTGWVQAELGDWEQAFETLYRAVALGEQLGATLPTLEAMNFLGMLFLRRNRLEDAIRSFQTVVVDIYHGPSCHTLLHSARCNLGWAYLRAGELPAAEITLHQADRWAASSGNKRELAVLGWRVADLRMRQGRYDDAARRLAEGRRLADELGLPLQLGELLRTEGLLAAERDDALGAGRSFEQAVMALERVGDGFPLARARLQFGRWLVGQGDHERAAPVLEAAARMFRRLAVVAEFEEANRLLFDIKVDTDRERALLEGLKGLVDVRLEPVTLFERVLPLVGRALGFDSGAVLVEDRPVAVFGRPNLPAAAAAGRERHEPEAGATLSIPVRVEDRFLGTIYLERREQIRVPTGHRTLEKVAGLLAEPMAHLARLPQCRGEGGITIPGLVFRGVVGTNEAMVENLKMVARAADLRVPVLVRGESGTGKELVALALHESGRRREGPFVPVNCAAVPANLLEADFFGVERGAATGVAERKGKFELADSGTIFLDEIGDMSPELQARLLRVLQDGEFERVGGTKRIRTDTRVVAATNKDLEALLGQERFRADLYYRLNGVDITLPPVRERREDTPALVRCLVDRCNREFGKDVAGVEDAVMDVFFAHDWPGNVRELHHVIQRALMLAKGEVIRVRDLPRELQALRPRQKAGKETTRREAQRQSKARAEKKMVRDCLDKSGGNASEAARLCGYSRAQFYRMMKRHGITAKRSPQAESD